MSGPRAVHRGVWMGCGIVNGPLYPKTLVECGKSPTRSLHPPLNTTTRPVYAAIISDFVQRS
jgi:hypothetical protein